MCTVNGKSMNTIMEEFRQPFSMKETYIKVITTIKNKDKEYGLAVPYIKPYSVKNRFNQIIGAGYWKAEFRETAGGHICSLSLRTTYEYGRHEWIAMEQGAQHTVEESKNTDTIKGSMSQAFKKAAQMWGIGEYLNRIPGVWGEMTIQGNKKCLNIQEEEKVKAELEKRIYGDINIVTPDEAAAAESKDIQAKGTQLETIRNLVKTYAEIKGTKIAEVRKMIYQYYNVSKYEQLKMMQAQKVITSLKIEIQKLQQKVTDAV